MALMGRQKGVIAALVLYWPTIFAIAHVPVPEVVRQAHMSDKSLHLLVYMILTFLLQSALRPREKVRWRQAATWWVIGVIILYGVVDESLQHYVAGRSADARDLLADAAGAFGTLGIMTVLSFWPASLVVTGLTIYTLTIFTRANLTALLPVTTVLFHFAGYGLFTLLWIACTHRRPSHERSGARWFATTASVPAGLIIITKASALISGKSFEGWDVIAAGVGILGAAAVASLAECLGRKKAQSRANLNAGDETVEPEAMVP